MSHLSSNIPFKLFYAACMAEILRIGRVTSTKTNFINHCSTVISRMINQGVLTPFSRQYPNHLVDTLRFFSKFFATSLEFVESICT